MSMDKHILSAIKLIFFNFVNFVIFLISPLNLLLLQLQLSLNILALIIVIAFYMVFQSILFIAYKKYKILLLILLHVPLFRHISLQFSNLNIGYLLNTVLILSYVALLIMHFHYGNFII